MYDLIERLAQEVCEGKKTLLQVERHLWKKGIPDAGCVMQKIMDRISERKKGNGKAD